MDLGGPSTSGLADGLRSASLTPRAIRMHLEDSTIHRDDFELNAHYLFALQVFEYPIEHTVLGPAVHAGVDGVPSTESRR